MVGVRSARMDDGGSRGGGGGLQWLSHNHYPRVHKSIINITCMFLSCIST